MASGSETTFSLLSSSLLSPFPFPSAKFAGSTSRIDPGVRLLIQTSFSCTFPFFLFPSLSLSPAHTHAHHTAASASAGPGKMEPFTRRELEKWITETSNLLVDHQKQLTSARSNVGYNSCLPRNESICHRRSNQCDEASKMGDEKCRPSFGSSRLGPSTSHSSDASDVSSCFTGHIVSLVPVAILIVLLLFFTLYLALSLSLLFRSN